MVSEQRKVNRRNLSYYLPIRDVEADKHIGVLVDISPRGFRLDSSVPISNGKVSHLRLDLAGADPSQGPIVVTGESKWCRQDFIDPSTYFVGFEILHLSPDGERYFQQLYESGKETDQSSSNDKYNYLWK